MGGIARTLGHLHDREGRRIRLTHPDGNFFAFEYDGLGRSVRTRENGSGIQAYFTYHPSGERRMRHLWSILALSDYDPLQRLESLSAYYGPQVGDVLYGFGYNPASQIVRETRSNDSYAWTGGVAVSRNYGSNGQNQYTGSPSAAPPRGIDPALGESRKAEGPAGNGGAFFVRRPGAPVRRDNNIHYGSNIYLSAD